MRRLLIGWGLFTACTPHSTRLHLALEESGDTDVQAAADCDETYATELDYIPQGTRFSGDRLACESVTHATAGAEDSVIRVRLDHWEAEEAARVSAVNLLGETVLGPLLLTEGSQFDLPLTQSGEVLIRIDADASDSEYTLSVACESGCDREYSRYPIVLMHGAAPADMVLLNYFFDVVPTLEDAGYVVIAPQVEPWRSTEDRAVQAWEQVQAAADAGLGRRFHLIGHSQGGLDARYVADALDNGHQVATVTTLSSPNRGAPLADVASGIIELSPLDGIGIDFAATVLLGVIGGGDQDATACIDSMTSTTTEVFNNDHPDRSDVAYFSWSGRSCGVLDFGCQDEFDGEVIAPYLAPAFQITAWFGGDNDGLVPVESAKWGTYLGVMGADHFDQVGQIAGVTDGDFDHRAFFLGEARRLAAWEE